MDTVSDTLVLLYAALAEANELLEIAERNNERFNIKVNKRLIKRLRRQIKTYEKKALENFKSW
jgi:hypothetical protein